PEEAPPAEEVIPAAPTATNHEESTLDLAGKPPGTTGASGSGTKGQPSTGPRSGKTTRVARVGTPTTKRARPSSEKQRRAQAPAPEFWTQQRIILAVSGGGLFLVLCVGLLSWALTRSPENK